MQSCPALDDYRRMIQIDADNVLGHFSRASSSTHYGNTTGPCAKLILPSTSNWTERRGFADEA